MFQKLKSITSQLLCPWLLVHSHQRWGCTELAFCCWMTSTLPLGNQTLVPIPTRTFMFFLYSHIDCLELQKWNHTHGWLYWWFTFTANGLTAVADLAPAGDMLWGDVLITTICVTLQRTLLWCSDARGSKGTFSCDSEVVQSTVGYFSGFILWMISVWIFGTHHVKKASTLIFFSWTHNLNLWCRKLQQRSPSLTKTPNNVCIWPNKVLVWVSRIICGHKGTNKSNKIWQMSKSLFQFYRFKDFFFIYVFIQHILHV